jgi:hypothetical protein
MVRLNAGRSVAVNDKGTAERDREDAPEAVRPNDLDFQQAGRLRAADHVPRAGEGSFTELQAEDLAAQLKSGALPVDFRVTATRTSGPSASSQAAAG